MAETPTGRDYAEALADFLQAVGVRQASLLGNSFGSRVAQCFAWFYPERVRRMVLTGTAIGQPGLPVEDRAAALVARQAQVAAGGYGFGERVAALLGTQASPETAALVQSVLRATNPAGFLQAVRFGLGHTYTPAFASRLSMPVLLIQGKGPDHPAGAQRRGAARGAGGCPDGGAGGGGASAGGGGAGDG